MIGWRDDRCPGTMVALAAEVGAHVGRERAHGVQGVAQAGFGAVQGLAPVVHLNGGLDVDAGGVGGWTQGGRHGRVEFKVEMTQNRFTGQYSGMISSAKVALSVGGAGGFLSCSRMKP